MGSPGLRFSKFLLGLLEQFSRNGNPGRENLAVLGAEVPEWRGIGMVNLPEIGLIFLFVSDLKRSREFYVEKLGFQLEYEGEDFVRIRPSHGPSVMLHSAHGRNLASAGFELELKVDDVDKWYERLSKEGVRFARPPSEIVHEGDPSGPRREATLSDPDEYRLALFTPLKK